MSSSLSLFLSFHFGLYQVWFGEQRPVLGGNRQDLGRTSERISGNRKHHSELRHEIHSEVKGGKMAAGEKRWD